MILLGWNVGVGHGNNSPRSKPGVVLYTKGLENIKALRSNLVRQSQVGSLFLLALVVGYGYFGGAGRGIT